MNNKTKEILRFCVNKGMLLDKEVFETVVKIKDKESIEELLERINMVCKERLVTKSFFNNNIERLGEVFQDEKKKILEKIYINLGINIEIKKELKVREEERQVKMEEEGMKSLNDLRVICSYVLPTRKLEVGHFVKYFRNRFLEMKNILQERNELNNLVSINKLQGYRQGQVSIIGAIVNKRITKNKNILLELEDLTGRINVLVNRSNADVFEEANSTLLDDIIGVRGTSNGELFFVNNIVYPDSSLPEKSHLDKEEYVAFISDLHVGSSMFLEENFLRFVDWINGRIGDDLQKKIAFKTRYLFVAGDSIDGVGVYPGQEELLNIKDIREQYEELARLFRMIRKDVKIVICPGQHDAVRVAEPQPPIDKHYADSLYKLDNVLFVSNPAMIEIVDSSRRSMKVLMYHGASMNSFINDIEVLRVEKAHNNPAKVVRHILKRRHLAPTHSSVTYIPSEKFDPLMIKEVPDIINTADLHRPDIDLYNNILIITSSCWQSITPFEEKVGNNPDPCKVPLLNLKTRAVRILDFS